MDGLITAEKCDLFDLPVEQSAGRQRLDQNIFARRSQHEGIKNAVFLHEADVLLRKLLMVFSLTTVLHFQRPLAKGFPWTSTIDTFTIYSQEVPDSDKIRGLVFGQSAVTAQGNIHHDHAVFTDRIDGVSDHHRNTHSIHRPFAIEPTARHIGCPHPGFGFDIARTAAFQIVGEGGLVFFGILKGEDDGLFAVVFLQVAVDVIL